MQLHFSRLSEKDRRQYAALESLKLGRGALHTLARYLGPIARQYYKGERN